MSDWITFGPPDGDLPGTTVYDFRLDLTSPVGKTAVHSQIILACDNNCTYWVNGEFIGVQSHWDASNSFCGQLSASKNVFVIRAQKKGTPLPNALIIATIQINYSDGSFDIFVTNTGWRANYLTPGSEQVNFDDSTWPHANIIGAPPWHEPAPPGGPSDVSLDDARWIWTHEVSPGKPNKKTPTGSHVFRTNFTIHGGSKVSSGAIAIAADDRYQLYVQGKQVGVTPSNWKAGQRWQFKLDSPASVVFIAVEAENAGSFAGLIATAALETTLDSCSATIFYPTDENWQYSAKVNPGFEKTDLDISSWPHVVQEGLYGGAPWHKIPITNAN